MDYYPITLTAMRAPAPFAERGFDPWSAEIATMDHAAMNIARLVDGIGAALVAVVRGIASMVRNVRGPVEIEPVAIKRPAEVASPRPAERAAA